MQSQNPYVRQIGARQLVGFLTTVGIATPVAMDSAQKMTGITKKMYQAYKDRFAADYEKTASMMPVTQQEEDRSWKASNLSYLLPYESVSAPFKAAMQTIMEGKDTDESTALLFAKSMKDFFYKTLEPFIQPSIFFETTKEMIPNNDLQFRTKQGSLIADLKNDPDWINKVMYHVYKKITPTTIRSFEEIGQAIGGDLSKSGIKRDLWDTVVKVFTGFSVIKQDPYTAMRFKLGKYSGDLQRVNEAFVNDIANAGKLKKDAELISRGLPGETFSKEYETKQSNSYRVLSEVYKDVQALRTLNFTEAEIRNLLSGRRALSKADVNMVMTGTFSPENIPNFKKDSAVANTIKQINRELGTDYKVDDFVDRERLIEIKKSYQAVPLGLSEEEREEYLRTTLEKKLNILEPKIEAGSELLEQQLDQGLPQDPNQQKLPKDDQSVKPQTPAAPYLPDPQIANMFAQNIDPTTGLTRTESALLSPSEQIIAKRNRII